MRRRFVEALRRAEIISLVNAASDRTTLGRTVVEELTEAFDAEIGVVAHRAPGSDGWDLIGATGIGPEVGQAFVAGIGEPESGDSIAAEAGERLSDGRCAALGALHRGLKGGTTLISVVCLYETEFDDAEEALLDAVTASVGHALERFWAEGERERLVAEAHEASIATATALANALEARDDYTAGHAQVIAQLAVDVSRRLELEDAEVERVRWGAIFHDIGKIAVPDEILRKPGPLSPPERELMRGHAVAGEEILAPVAFLDDVRPLVRHSHERWDGEGYPDGLSGTDIPIGARIICVVDAWHAMVSDRVYRKALSRDAAIEELRRHAGTQFDPEIVEVFLDLGPQSG